MRVGCKIKFNIQKWVLFLYTTSDWLENENFLSIICNSVKNIFLAAVSGKDVKDFTEYYRPLQREIEYLNKWREIPSCSVHVHIYIWYMFMYPSAQYSLTFFSLKRTVKIKKKTL